MYYTTLFPYAMLSPIIRYFCHRAYDYHLGIYVTKLSGHHLHSFWDFFFLLSISSSYEPQVLLAYVIDNIDNISSSLFCNLFMTYVIDNSLSGFTSHLISCNPLQITYLPHQCTYLPTGNLFIRVHNSTADSTHVVRRVKHYAASVAGTPLILIKFNV